MKHKSSLCLLVVMAVSFVSCTNVDTKDIFSIAEQVEKSLKQNKIDNLKPFYIHQMDSLTQEAKDRIREVQDFYKEKSVKRIEIDTASILWFTVCDISYLVNDTYYEVRFFYDRDSLGNIVIGKVGSPVLRNISKICAEDEEEPYCPKWEIDFKRLSWTTDYYEKTFKSGRIELQNNTDSDINYIKFRVKLIKNSNYETFLNQTVESYKPIYKGDIVTIEVPGMSDYYTGFTIDKNTFQFGAELMEIKPKPTSNVCLKIQKLDKEVKTMLNKK